MNSAISHNGVGVHPKSIINTVSNPITTVSQNGGVIRYNGEEANVVLNQEGKIITTWPYGTQYQRRK